MRNKRFSETGLLRSLADRLRSRAPAGWSIEIQETGSRSVKRPDAIVKVANPEGTTGWLVVEAKSQLEPRDIPNLLWQLRQVAAAMNQPDARPFIIAPFIGVRSRERLTYEDVGYADATGNLRLVLDRPAIFIEAAGAERDPWPDSRPLRSLRGGAAGRAVRAFCDFLPPYGIRQLADLSRTSAPTLSRVAELLEREGVLNRKATRGPIGAVDWQAVIRRWTQDYSFMASNRIRTYLEPRGLKAVLRKLPDADLSYAVTGSIAAAGFAPIVEPRLAVVYVGDAEAAAGILGLRPAESGANVVLAEPFDPVVFERTRLINGVTCAGVSQIAADLSTSPGRAPSEAEALITWMGDNESKWRIRTSTS